MTDETPTPADPVPGPTAGPTPGPSPLSQRLPERARIEHTAPKRLDALPVLYLVGFVILAASLIYLWKHPGLPRNAALEVARMDQVRTQLDTLQARVANIEARPAPAAPDLGPIRAELNELANRPAGVPAAFGPLQDRVAALEARPAPPPVDLGPLRQQLDALGKQSAAAGASAQQQADALAALGKRLDATEAALKQSDAQVQQLAAQLKQANERVAAVAQKAAMGSRLQAAVAALDAGQRLGDIQGAPPALARFAHDDPPTEASLRLSFDHAAAEAHRVSQPALTDNQPLLERMWTRATQSVTVRQGEHVLVGDPIAGAIAAARQSLDAGDLAGAVKALDGLAGPAKAAMADWVGQAQALLDARAAIGEMAAHG